MERVPMSDETLNNDLREIDAEVARRKKAHPFEPYAFWAFAARQSALDRFSQRHGDQQTERRMEA